MSHQNNNLLSHESLAAAQGRNLTFIEEFTSGTYKILGIPILQVLTYSLIQTLNNMYLQEILKNDEGKDK